MRGQKHPTSPVSMMYHIISPSTHSSSDTYRYIYNSMYPSTLPFSYLHFQHQNPSNPSNIYIKFWSRSDANMSPSQEPPLPTSFPLKIAHGKTIDIPSVGYGTWASGTVDCVFHFSLPLFLIPQCPVLLLSSRPVCLSGLLLSVTVWAYDFLNKTWKKTNANMLWRLQEREDGVNKLFWMPWRPGIDIWIVLGCMVYVIYLPAYQSIGS